MFLESVRFPTNISFGSSGGPQFKTSVSFTNSGFEYNNIDWDQSRHRYDVSLGIRTETELAELIKFFHITRGRGHSFRYKDWADYKTCEVYENTHHSDQLIGVGDGSTTAFQLIKSYDLGYGIVNERDITKPVNNTVTIGLDGVIQPSGYSIDYTTGILTFDSAPAAAVEVSWGGEFDVPCRFDTDELNINLAFFKHGNIDNIPVIEIRI